MKNDPWIIKYAPKTIDEYIFYNEVFESRIRKLVQSGFLPHMIFSGKPGCGKTTLAKILLHEVGIEDFDAIKINASDENSVDTIRTKVKAFISSCALGKFKVVLMDEADYLSEPAQSVLRGMMDDFIDNAKFIFTCNDFSKLHNALISRCEHFHFNPPPKPNVTEYIYKILQKEQVECTSESIINLVDTSYPDIRKTIINAQQLSNDGNLRTNVIVNDWKLHALELIDQDRWDDHRRLVCASVPDCDFNEYYDFLFSNLDRSPTFNKYENWKRAVLLITDHLHKNASISNPFINVSALLIQLEEIAGS